LASCSRARRGCCSTTGRRRVWVPGDAVVQRGTNHAWANRSTAAFGWCS
jgi:hypothetical protein